MFWHCCRHYSINWNWWEFYEPIWLWDHFYILQDMYVNTMFEFGQTKYLVSWLAWTKKAVFDVLAQYHVISALSFCWNHCKVELYTSTCWSYELFPKWWMKSLFLDKRNNISLCQCCSSFSCWEIFPQRRIRRGDSKVWSPYLTLNAWNIINGVMINKMSTVR